MNFSGPAWEDWKKALVTLPDAAFFSLIRHYLGPIQTPFNKQLLVQELVSRISLGEVANNRRLLLSEEDADLLAALLYLGPSAPEEVTAFLDVSATTLPLRLLNLEERLWIYRRSDGGRTVYQASPLASDEALSRRLAPSRFFAGFSQPPTEGPPVFDEGVFLALYSALAEAPPEKNQTGEWKKRTRREFLERFAGLPGEETGADLLLAAAEHLGLIVWEDQRLRLVDSYWEDLGTIQADDRTALLSCAFGPWRSGALNQAAKGFWQFAALVRPDTAYTWSVLRRLAGRVEDWKNPSDREALMKAWTQTGHLIGGTRSGTWIFRPQSSEKLSSRSAILEANFEWRLFPGGVWSKVLPIVRASRLIRWERHPHFELSKASLQRAFAQGLEAPKLADDLEELTGHPLPQNIRVSLSEWENQTRSLRLWRGLVLQVDSAKDHLLAHAPLFQASVLETLGPGVYLLDPTSLEEAERDLNRLGFPSFPLPKEGRRNDSDGHPWSFAHWTASRPESASPVFKETLDLMSEEDLVENVEESSDENASELLAVWRQEIETSDRREEEKEELLGRLQRKLIVESAQLSFPVVRGEKLEARGLDYVGKLRLIEQALASAYDSLEIVARDSTGHPVSLTVRPVKLERQGTEMLLRAESLEKGEAFHGFVSRMALVRRIRGSLFW